MVLSAPEQRPLRVFVGEPSGIDPAHGFEHDGALILRFLADPLVEFTPHSGQIRAAAARSWAVDEDGRRVVFELRDDVRFHHGRPVLADDYVYSLSRVARPETRSKLSYNLRNIEGYEAVRSGEATELSGVRALGRHRLEVRLTEPFHEIAAIFSHRVTAAVPAELAESDPSAFALNPVSTGPYQMAEPADFRRRVRLRQYDRYYGQNRAYDDGGAGHVPLLEFCVYDDIEQGLVDWRSGYLDVTKVPPARLEEAKALGDDFVATPCALMQYLGFPTARAPFDDPVVRRAISMCIDRQAIIDSAFAGMRPIANRIVPPMLRDQRAADDDLLHLAFDPAAAHMLLDAAGVALPRTRFRYNAGLGHDGWVGVVTQGLHDSLDWDIVPEPVEWSAFLRWLPHADSPFRMTWLIDVPSVDNFLFSLLHSSSLDQDNFTRYINVDVDRSIDAARATADAASRQRLYLEAERRACSDVPLLPLWFGVQHNLVARKRFDIRGHPIDLFGEPCLRLFSAR